MRINEGSPASIKNAIVKELILKSFLNSFIIYGAKEKYDEGVLLKKYLAVEIEEDQGSDSEILLCAQRYLKLSLDRKFLKIYTSAIPTPGGGGIDDGGGIEGGSGSGGYIGSIATDIEAEIIHGELHTNGSWWNILGDFEYNGVSYFTGEEVYWIDGNFEKQGYSNAFTRVIVAPGNISMEQDGNWRMRVTNTGSFVIEKMIDDVWVIMEEKF
jgi:hypothetical protein